MRLTSRSSRHSAAIELQMTSMIDVVFLLLIFFMVTSSWQKTERQLDPAIKVQRAGAGEQRGELEPAIVDVVRGDAGFVFRLGGREFTSAEELTGVLSQFENKLDGAFVRAVDEAPFEMAASAIQACKSARFAAVSYVPLVE
jgi:biopolymer transport protein ExbD